MTEYALAPNAKFTADSPYRTPRVMLEQGLLTAYRVRANGTMRHLELYPLDGTLREAAEYVSDRVDMDGASVQAVARELWVSTATIRRYLEGLELTEEIESGDWDGLSFDSAGNPVWDTAWTETEAEVVELAGDEDETPAPVVDPQPVTSTRAGRKCTVCGKGVTARNSAAKVYGSRGYEDMCVTCYDQAGLENEHADGHHADEPNTDCPQCKDTILLARNRARFTSTPQPTEDEVAATIAEIKAEKAARDVQVGEAPGAQCEPVGTTADDLEADLAASVAAVAKGATLAVCFCNGLGSHRPGGMPSCKFAGNAAPAVARKPRSH